MARRIAYFSGADLDRAPQLRRDPDRLVALFRQTETCILPLSHTRNLVRANDQGFSAVSLSGSDADRLGAVEPIFLGLLNSVAYFAVDISTEIEADLTDLGEFADLRQIGALLPQSTGAILAYARGISFWHSTHRFCNRCGGPTFSEQGGHVRRCHACGTEHYPRSDPAVIMRVTHGDHCLLGRQAVWPDGMLSVLAGFVEPGETMEEAVAREVFEEVGIRVGDVRYHSSQPWPFPSSLMIGFTAEAESLAAPVVDGVELQSANWFSRADILDFGASGHFLPRPHSIARRLIEDWLEQA
jgi:NAD+ diphosphatase